LNRTGGQAKTPTAPAERRPRIAEHLQHYVYALIDPRDGSIFYVGKGSGERYHRHAWEEQLWDQDHDDRATRRKKLAQIREIRASGSRPRIDVVRHGLDEKSALLVEAALIDCLTLSNEVHGFWTETSRATLHELERRYGAPPLTTTRRALLIKLGPWQDTPNQDLGRRGHGYCTGISDQDLYQSVRGIWHVDVNRVSSFRYAVAVHAGVTRGVWEIDHSSWKTYSDQNARPRVAFEGKAISSGPVFDDFVGPLGRHIPTLRLTGQRYVFGNQAVTAYWPD
jgi:hypothetical protein